MLVRISRKLFFKWTDNHKQICNLAILLVSTWNFRFYIKTLANENPEPEIKDFKVRKLTKEADDVAFSWNLPEPELLHCDKILITWKICQEIGFWQKKSGSKKAEDVQNI